LTESKNMTELPRELRTARDFIRWGASRFNREGLVFGHGADNALDEAAWLVTHALALPPDLPDRYLESRLTKAEKRSIADLFDRRVIERRPAAYLTHEAWFAGLKFYVDERVLVPRSPIAEMVENFFEPWIERDNVRRVLDLCTGSGCIGIACAYAFPNADVELVDISADALAVSQENIRRHGLDPRVQIRRSDLFAEVKGQFDIIVSNPPYVHAAEMDALPREYGHEPRLGLAAADQGLEFALRILREAHRHLKEGGILVVEVGDAQRALVERLPHVPFVWLEFQRGADGVFLMTREALAEVMTLIIAR
jgi:ribosomal protein L3 glutamine methyltransferase